MPYAVPEAVVRQRLRALRHARGLSQEELASRCAISVKHYQDLESGRKGFNPSLATLNALAENLELEVHRLLLPDTDPPDPSL